MKPCSLFILTAVLLLSSCKKDKTILGTIYTHKLDRSFGWQRSYYTTRGSLDDTTYFYTDTIVPIKVVDDNLIRFLDYNLTLTNYNYTNSFDKTTLPTNEYLHYVAIDSLGPHKTIYLNYYYQRDSVCFIYSSGGLGGNSKRIYTIKL